MSRAATNFATQVPLDTPVLPYTAALSYTAAVAQLNSLVPELYASAELPRAQVFSRRGPDPARCAGQSARAFPRGADCRNQRKRLDRLNAGFDSDGGWPAHRALHFAAPEAAQRTHPHWESRNRIEIADEDFARLYFRVHDAGQELVLAGRLPQLPSYFEILTALAFLYFAENKVDIAVLEVGMGGRLDATNVVDPLLSIITDISLDHMEWLGPTITAIAREKAGILRRGGTMITLPQHPEANQVLGEVAAELDVRGVSAVPYMPACRNQRAVLR